MATVAPEDPLLCVVVDLGFAPRNRGQACSTMRADAVKAVEFKFPDGDFEIDTTTRMPRSGELLTRRSRVWSVYDVLPGRPPLVILEPAPPRRVPRP